MNPALDDSATHSTTPRVASGSGRLTGVAARMMSVDPRVQFVATIVLLALPLIIALVVLAQDRWYPVLDLAMTELRVRDVGTSHTPAIGLPGRIGALPEQGSHPGPLSFWVVAPIYRLLGQTAYSMEVATVIVHLLVVALILWCCYRVAGRRGVLVGGVLVALLMRGYGQLLLTQPWNPYFPLLAWLLVLVATTAVIAGHPRWIVAIVAAGTFCAQTHIPYLLLGVGMFVLAAGTIVWRAIRSDAPQRRSLIGPLAVSAGLGVLLWSPPIVQELGGGEGNITRLLDHFGSPSEDVVGFGRAVSIMLRHLNPWEVFTALLTGPRDRYGVTMEPFMAIGNASDVARWPGALLLLVWVGAVVVAWRLGSTRLRAVHTVAATGLVLAWVSTARIFGNTWYYLTLWMWAIGALMVLGVIGSALTVAARGWQRRGGDVAAAGAAAAATATVVFAASTVLFSLDAVQAQHPEEHLSEELGALVAPTSDAITAGVGAATGPDGRYLLRWSDAHSFGSQAFGLLNELERSGIDVGTDPYWAVPATSHRVIEAGDATAQIQLVTGVYVDDWRRQEEAIEVASVDLRSPQDRTRYATLRDALRDDLRAHGLDDLLPWLQRNVFGLSIDPRISDEARQYATEMLQIGTELAVFIAPPGTAP